MITTVAAPAPILWVQGLRPPEEISADSPMGWPELLLRRLTGRLSKIVPGVTTMGSEDLLGLGRNTYFYLGKCFPKFGHLLVAHEGHHAASSRQTHIAPFDTGGLAIDHIATSSKLSDAEKKAVVARHSFGTAAYPAEFESWVGSAFVNRRDYFAGLRPLSSLVSEIDLSACTVQAWTWEARVETQDYPDAPITPVKIIFKTGEKELYLDWLEVDRTLSRDEGKEHIARVESCSIETDTPFNDMSSYLVKGTR